MKWKQMRSEKQTKANLCMALQQTGFYKSTSTMCSVEKVCKKKYVFPGRETEKKLTVVV
jgi:hypothetical protein